MARRAVSAVSDELGAAAQRAAGWLGLVGGTLGELAGLLQATIGNRIPCWTGNKADPTALGLLLGSISNPGAFEVLMAVSAGPVLTIAVGVIGGLALMAAPWVTSGAVSRNVERSKSAVVPTVLLMIGTVPFAVIAWWSVVPRCSPLSP